MPVRFTCPKCLTPNSWPTSTAGTTVRCPVCSKRVTIPANVPRRVQKFPSATEADFDPPEAPRLQFEPEPAPIPESSAIRTRESNYPALSIVATCYHVLAILAGIVTLFMAVTGVAGLLEGGITGVALLSLIINLVGGAVAVVTLLAVGEGIRLMIDIVGTLRQIRDEMRGTS